MLHNSSSRMRYRYTLVILLAVLTLLSACGFGGDPDPISANPTAAPDATAEVAAAPAAPTATSEGVVTIGFGAQEFERRIYEPLIETFNQQNPNIRVQFVSLDEITRPAEGETFDPGRMM